MLYLSLYQQRGTWYLAVGIWPITKYRISAFLQHLFFLLLALPFHAQDGDALKMGNQQPGRNHGHESDKPQHDAATGGYLWGDVKHPAQSADGCKLRAATHHRKLENSSHHAGGGQQQHTGKRHVRQAVDRVRMGYADIGEAYDDPNKQ